MDMQNRFDWKNALNTGVVIFFMFIFRFLPPFGGLSTLGMQILGTFIGTLYGWIMIGIGWPSFLGLISFALTDYCSMSDIFVASFGSQTIILIMILLMITAFVGQTGLDRIIVKFLLTRKSANGRPWLTVYFFLLACWACSLLGYCLAATVLFIEFTRVIAKDVGFEPHSKQISVFMVGNILASTVGEMCMPFKTTPILFLSTFEACSGKAIDLAVYTLYVFPTSMLVIILFVLFCKFILRIDMSALKDMGDLPGLDVKATKRQKYSLVAVIAVLLALLLPSILPEGGVLKGILSTLGLGGSAILLVGVMMMIRIEGKPLLELHKITAYYQWEVLFVIALLNPLANALCSDTVGIKVIISQAIAGFVSGLSPWMFAFVIVLLSALLTNFSNNMVIGAMFISMVNILAPSLPAVNITAVCMLVVFSANLACFFPAASPMNAIVFAQKDIVSFEKNALLGFEVCMFFVVLLSTVGWAYVHWLF